MVADHQAMGLTTGRHPMALLRESLDPVIRTAASLREGSGGRVTVAGVMVARQRPGTAKGIVFLLLEDESGMVNVIVPPDVYERDRITVRSEPLVQVWGRLERRQGTLNVIADRVAALQSQAPAADRARRGADRRGRTGGRGGRRQRRRPGRPGGRPEGAAGGGAPAQQLRAGQAVRSHRRPIFGVSVDASASPRGGGPHEGNRRHTGRPGPDHGRVRLEFELEHRPPPALRRPGRRRRPATISTAKVAGLGTILVNTQGHTLYMFVPDNKRRVTCVGSCAALWPPLKISGSTPSAGGRPSRR